MPRVPASALGLLLLLAARALPAQASEATGISLRLGFDRDQRVRGSVGSDRG